MNKQNIIIFFTFICAMSFVANAGYIEVSPDVTGFVEDVSAIIAVSLPSIYVEDFDCFSIFSFDVESTDLFNCLNNVFRWRHDLGQLVSLEFCLCFQRNSCIFEQFNCVLLMETELDISDIVKSQR